MRDDGYHLLDTLMVPISLYDEIEITRPGRRAGKDGLRVTCDHPGVPPGKKNLAYRAAFFLLRKKGLHESVHIHIRKRIPVGAGLGGGSSDAAATLRGLNRLFHLGCDQSEILSLAASLGADVPFFVYGRPARAQGIGDRLRPVFSLPRFWMVVLYPGFAVSTRWAYENLAFRLTKRIENTSINFSWEDPGELKRLLVNDLERVTIRRYPRLAFLKERLIQEGADGALMSGSGSSVFGIFLKRQRAREAFRRLRKEREEGVRVYLVRSLS